MSVNDDLHWISVVALHFLELAGFGVDDESAHNDVFWHEWMMLDGIDGFSDRLRRVLKAFEPMVEVDAAFADCVESMVGHSAL